jgi:hypothetical protein
MQPGWVHDLVSHPVKIRWYRHPCTRHSPSLNFQDKVFKWRLESLSERLVGRRHLSIPHLLRYGEQIDLLYLSLFSYLCELRHQPDNSVCVSKLIQWVASYCQVSLIELIIQVYYLALFALFLALGLADRMTTILLSPSSPSNLFN